MVSFAKIEKRSSVHTAAILISNVVLTPANTSDLELEKTSKMAYNYTVSGSKRRSRPTQHDYLWSYLLSHPCVDCNETDPLTLQFDHIVDGKHDAVTDLLARTRAVLEAEIARCVVRCANCHARMTALRSRSWRAVRAGYFDLKLDTT